MSTFSDAEVEYLTSQPLGRLATADARGRPHVMPVGLFYDPEAEGIVVGGISMGASKKFRDVRGRPDVAIVVDDLASVDPWTPRGIEIRGRAETYAEGGEEVGKRLGAGFPFDAAWILIRPHRILAWGLGAPEFLEARDVT